MECEVWVLMLCVLEWQCEEHASYAKVCTQKIGLSGSYRIVPLRRCVPPVGETFDCGQLVQVWCRAGGHRDCGQCGAVGMNAMDQLGAAKVVMPQLTSRVS